MSFCLSVAGFAWCLPEGAFGRSFYLRLLGVRADLTGRGVGAELLAAVESQAFESNSDMFLLVSDFNQAAHRFFVLNTRRVSWASRTSFNY